MLDFVGEGDDGVSGIDLGVPWPGEEIVSDEPPEQVALTDGHLDLVVGCVCPAVQLVRSL